MHVFLQSGVLVFAQEYVTQLCMPRLQFRHGHKLESGGPIATPCPTHVHVHMCTLNKLIQIDALFSHFVLAQVHFGRDTQKD